VFLVRVRKKIRGETRLWLPLSTAEQPEAVLQKPIRALYKKLASHLVKENLLTLRHLHHSPLPHPKELLGSDIFTLFTEKRGFFE
jgi:hypothetical protein